MKTLRRAIHDLWCLISDRCHITLEPDALLNELRAHEQAANVAADRIRERRIARQNVIEQRYLGRRQP